jgi:hypothetical protein
MPEFHFDTIKTFPSIFSKYSLNSNEYITGGTENISYPLNLLRKQRKFNLKIKVEAKKIMNSEMREKLLLMAAEDQSVREELAKTGELFDGYHPRMEAVHLANAAALEKMIEDAGGEWLGKSLVGSDGAEAAWLIAQHSISLPDFSRRCLRLLRRAVAAGEAESRQMAYLEDRINFFERKPQRYGTQSDRNADGKMQVWTLEDESRVNEFRASVGLKPLENLVRESEELRGNAPADFARRQKEAEEWREKTGWTTK